MKVAGYVVLTYVFRKADKRWTVHCEELGTATFGRSLPEAEKRLNEAVLLHLNTLEDVGERERFFEEHDIQFHLTKPRESITVSLSLKEEVFVHPHIQRIPALSTA